MAFYLGIPIFLLIGPCLCSEKTKKRTREQNDSSFDHMAASGQTIKVRLYIPGREPRHLKLNADNKSIETINEKIYELQGVSKVTPYQTKEHFSLGEDERIDHAERDARAQDMQLKKTFLSGLKLHLVEKDGTRQLLESPQQLINSTTLEARVEAVFRRKLSGPGASSIGGAPNFVDTQDDIYGEKRQNDNVEKKTIETFRSGFEAFHATQLRCERRTEKKKHKDNVFCNGAATIPKNLDSDAIYI